MDKLSSVHIVSRRSLWAVISDIFLLHCLPKVSFDLSGRCFIIFTKNRHTISCPDRVIRCSWTTIKILKRSLTLSINLTWFDLLSLFTLCIHVRLLTAPHLFGSDDRLADSCEWWGNFFWEGKIKPTSCDNLTTSVKDLIPAEKSLWFSHEI